MLIKTYKASDEVKIVTINVTKFPLVIITDSHTNVANVRQLKELYPDSPFVSLGDITFLFAKPGEKYNARSVQYFIDNKIPCLKGNHEEHLVSCAASDNGDSLVIFKAIPRFDEHSSLYDKYDLSQQHTDYLKGLPMGFKLVLPNKDEYLCFHNRPSDLWSFTEEAFTQEAFEKTYPLSERTKSVIIGHNHRHFVKQYPSGKSLTCIGRLSVDGDYALLTERGIEQKRLPKSLTYLEK